MCKRFLSFFKKMLVLWILFFPIYGCTFDTPTLQVPESSSTILPGYENSTDTPIIIYPTVELNPTAQISSTAGSISPTVAPSPTRQISTTPVLISPTVAPSLFQQISANNFSKLSVYNHFVFPEKAEGILWLSKGDILGVWAANQVHTYNVPSFSFINKTELPKSRSIYDVTYLEGIGDVMLINQYGNLVLWDFSENKSIRTYSWPGADLISARLSPTSRLLARSGVLVQDRTRVIEIMDLDGNEIQRLVGHKNDAPVLEWSSDERFLAASAIGRDTDQNQILVWDIATGELLYLIPNPTIDAGIVKFNHYGDKMAVSNGSVVRLWDIKSRNWVGNEWKYDIGEGYINSLTFTLSDDILLAKTSTNQVLFINTQSGDLLELPDISENVVDAALSPDNRYLAVLHENGSINVWAVMND